MRCYFTYHYAPWCGFCKRVDPVFNQLRQHYANQSEIKLQKCCCEKRPNCHNSSYPKFYFHYHPRANEMEKIEYPQSQERTFEAMKEFIDRNLELARRN